LKKPISNKGRNESGRPGRGRPAARKPGSDRTGAKGSRLQSGSDGLGPERTGQWKSESKRSGKPESRGPGKPESKRSGKPESRPGGAKRGGLTFETTKKGSDKRGPSRAKDPGDEPVRLNKYIAASGICSRREADQLITAGLITVNGKNITELGTKVKSDDDVRYNGKRIRNERKVYLLLNKPKDYVTTTDDPKERKTVMLLIRNACSERIYPVGRLDRNTTGVLMFTNDGEMAKKLTHPGHNKKKIYHVFLNKGVTAGDLKKLADGITLEDGFIQPDAISYVSSEHKREIGLEIHSGRNRIVRRLFEHLGYTVTKLDRVYFAGLTKKNLPRGKWRFLSEQEVNRLKMNAYE
jgi:23S rRNA pseudouridine2605 synthase